MRPDMRQNEVMASLSSLLCAGGRYIVTGGFKCLMMKWGELGNLFFPD